MELGNDKFSSQDTPLYEKYRRFWSMLIDEYTSTRDDVRVRPNLKNYLLFKGGAESTCYRAFAYYGRPCVSYECRYHLITHRPESVKPLYDKLLADKQIIEQKFGSLLCWEQHDSCLKIKHNIVGVGSIRDEKLWPQIRKRMIESLDKFQEVFGPYTQGVRSHSWEVK